MFPTVSSVILAIISEIRDTSNLLEVHCSLSAAGWRREIITASILARQQETVPRFRVVHKRRVKQIKLVSYLCTSKQFIEGMARTYRVPIYGRRPPCDTNSRVEDWRERLRAQRLERPINPNKPEGFILYKDTKKEKDFAKQKHIFRTSYNFVDYLYSREIGAKEPRRVDTHFGIHSLLSRDMLKEHLVSAVNMDKVFCSRWLSHRQVIFGTKCNRILVYDVLRKNLVHIPCIRGRRDAGIPPRYGIFTLEINTSATLLATSGRDPRDVAVYHLPTLQPVCVGEGAHTDCVYGLCWLDEKHVVSASRDSRMALWEIMDDDVNNSEVTLTYKHLEPSESEECRSAQKLRAISFNKNFQEIVVLSLNGYIHIWSAETFKQKLSLKLPSSQENVCLAIQLPQGMYAIGCRSCTLLLDARTLQVVKKIPTRHGPCGIRSVSFEGKVLTMGNGMGVVMFYDMEAAKFLESTMKPNQTVLLKATRGSLYPGRECTPGIITHSYDPSLTRIFTAGGPMSADLCGFYASIWQ